MIVYFGKTVTVQANGQTWRVERCEHCKQQFYFPVRASVTGSAENPYFLDPESTSRAEEDARNRLALALSRDVVPVPCPHCSLYQEYMVPVVRSNQFTKMWSAGLALVVATPAFLLLGCIVSGGLPRLTGPGASGTFGMLVTLGLPALSFFTGFGVLIARQRKQTAYDPNAKQHTEDRRDLAAVTALKPEEFAKLQIQAPLPSPTLRQWGQLVGQNCVRCGQRIPGELDSRFCDGCGSPVHNRCIAPTEGGCVVCGAPPTERGS